MEIVSQIDWQSSKVWENLTRWKNNYVNIKFLSRLKDFVEKLVRVLVTSTYEKDGNLKLGEWNAIKGYFYTCQNFF